MCGITGFLDASGLSDNASSHLDSMVAALSHRGPDSSGSWLDRHRGIALGHTRLSIIDLSPAGNQPMASPSGRYQMVFNGEVYNHLELRKAVGNGVAWQGHSDTETLLASFERVGLVETLRRVVGMFALALWDRQENQLFLTRDRLGEKPLYYGWQGSTLLFASELKSLKVHPAFRFELDESCLASYLKNGYIPAPNSIYKGIRKLEPGHIYRCSVAPPQKAESLSAYWSLSDVVSSSEPFTGTDEDAVNELERLLTQAISLQRVADVPLGAFLSGGIDSSTIVALMQKNTTRPVRTFTVGFGESEFDESHAAREVAKHLGTEHEEIVVSPSESLRVIPLLPAMFDEPFGDVSAIPTWLLTKLARKQVTVALSGDGGDELFAGYDRYRRTAKLWTSVSRLGPIGKALGSSMLALVPADALQHLMVTAGIGRFPHLFKSRVAGVRAAFGASSVDQVYDLRMSLWSNPSKLLEQSSTPAASFASGAKYNRIDPTERMMVIDALSYMPDDVLVKVDRAAMSNSLETRVPLLDHRIVEFCWTLPQSMRVRDGTSKWLLRQLLYRYVPPSLLNRPKQGFGVPMGSWLRGPLREWAEEHLTDQRLASSPFKPKPIKDIWKQHLSGSVDWQHHLWPILAFQEWASHDARLRRSLSNTR